METIETNIIEKIISPINYVNSPQWFIQPIEHNTLQLVPVAENKALSEFLVDTNTSVKTVTLVVNKKYMSIDIFYKPL